MRHSANEDGSLTIAHDAVWDFAVAVHVALEHLPRTDGNARHRQTLYELRNALAESIKKTNPLLPKERRDER